MTAKSPRISAMIAVSMVLALTLILADPFQSSIAHAATTSSRISQQGLTHTPSGSVTQPPSWVTDAIPYVHIVNYVASVDPAIKLHLVPQEVKQVYSAVGKYNSFSPLQKEAQTTITSSLSVVQAVLQKDPKALTSSRVSVPQAVIHGCQMVVTGSWEWWGYQFYFNDCAVQTIAWVVGIGGGIAGLIGLACGPCAPFALPIAGFLGIYVATLLYLDYYCGGNGALLEMSWVGFFWFAALC